MFNGYQKIIKYLCALLILGITTVGTTHAQLNDIGAFLQAGADDATILTKEYLKPFPTGFGTGLNAGWTESAAPKKTLGFSLQIRPSIAVVPGSDQSFDISSLGLDKIVVAAGEDPVTSTISGSKGSGPLLEIYDDPNSNNPQKLGEFNMPGGTGFSFVPAPVVQASIGLVKKTDLTLRYFPETEIGDFGSFSIIGGAVKHEISQWLPGSKLLPVDISLMLGYNRIGVDAGLDLQETGTRDPNDPTLTSNPNPDFDSQKVVTTTETFVFNALVGKSLPLISVYGGLGYQKATFDLSVNGDYPVSSYNPITPGDDYIVVSDPISFSLDSKSSAHALAGFRLRLGILAIYGEATLANYFTANAGIGISFR
ncbi:MAG: hypothetical protein HUJ22_04990 [Gracilimonas sp.]|uniref:DUF6588 family protein n=1 Tax=Gracilimonas sp. TaxID=1974203 RepID=UPI0019BB67F6|nr:DUF6588 family protein [Gracilimonas sp.]MBD3615910.1 hypothetical protein [Gracilimonas sp.]